MKWEDMRVGQRVRFVGFTNPDHTHWEFTPDEVYDVTEDFDGDVGPADDGGSVPSCNWGFEFELVSDL